MKNLPKLINYIQSRSKFDDFHGIEHWEEVERNGILLAKYDSKINIKVVRYFAYLHDSCIEYNGNHSERIEHGKRAAKFCDEIRNTFLSSFSDNEFLLLRNACEYHTIKTSVGNITIDTCFDADRLDLPRVGIQPKASKMASKQGKEFVTNWDYYLDEYRRNFIDDLSKTKRNKALINRLFRKFKRKILIR